MNGSTPPPIPHNPDTPIMHALSLDKAGACQQLTTDRGISFIDYPADVDYHFCPPQSYRALSPYSLGWSQYPMPLIHTQSNLYTLKY